MKELPNVRIAEPTDRDEILAMCRRLHSENGLFSLNEKKLDNCLSKSFNRAGGIVGVIGDVGHIEASICMELSDFYYTDDWHLAELWNYVEPEYRKSRNAEALIEFGKSCSEKMGIPFITGIITNKHMAGKVRLYRRLLGYPAGAFFVHNSKWKSEPMEDHGTLRQRLKDFAQKCNDGKVSTGIARREVGPLLREAAVAIGSEDNLWGTSKTTNGATSHVNGSG